VIAVDAVAVNALVLPPSVDVTDTPSVSLP
jgi:hypothetical protein